MRGTRRNSPRPGQNPTPANGFITQTMTADRAINIAAGAHDVAVTQQDQGVARMGVHTGDAGCRLDKRIGRFQTTIAVLAAMG